MITSDTIGKLAEALAKAQAVMEGAAKDSSNPFFHSKYSSLAAVWDACRKPLSDNGLAVIQATDDGQDMVVVDTRLCHSSGEWIQGRLTVKPVKADPQGIGSCLTYARRYALSAMVGIAPEDDDGNAATGKTDGAKVYSLKGKELPKVDGMGEPLDVPDIETPLEEQPTTFLTADHPTHITIEQKIKDYQINRETFKVWLVDKKKIGFKDDRPSFSTMTVTDANKMLAQWNSVMTQYQNFLKKQSGTS